MRFHESQRALQVVGTLWLERVPLEGSDVRLGLTWGCGIHFNGCKLSKSRSYTDFHSHLVQLLLIDSATSTYVSRMIWWWNSGSKARKTLHLPKKRVIRPLKLVLRIRKTSWQIKYLKRPIQKSETSQVCWKV